MAVDRRLRADLLARAPELVSSWLPNGIRSGDEWLVGSLSGEPGKSLKINLNTGLWKDFAKPGIGGTDLISLHAAIFGKTYDQAIPAVRAILGATSARAGPKAKGRSVWPVPDSAPPPPLTRSTIRASPSAGRLTDSWTYRDASGEPLGHVLRFEKTGPDGVIKKQILPLFYFGTASGWRFKGHGHDNDPIYGLDRLATHPEKPILLVEGEKTADAAQKLFPEYVCISWLGGSQRAAKVDWSPLAGRPVTYWPDADEAGAQTVDVVTERLRFHDAAALKVVRLPHGLPKGWDLADEPPPEIVIAELLASAEDVDLKAVGRLQLLNRDGLVERLIYEAITMQFVDPLTGLTLDKPQLNGLFRHALGPGVAEQLLNDPRLRKAVGFTYRPGNRDVIVPHQDGTSKINLWRGNGLMPRPGDASIFIEHLRFLCPTDEEADYLCNWLAHVIQKPGVKIMCAVVLVGPQGTGKTAVSQIMTSILGTRNVAVVSTSEVKSDFNEWLRCRQLIVVEEIMALGRREIMNNLKPLITQRYVTINKKYQRPYEIENAANFMFLSNSVDALLLEQSDRRYFVVSSDSSPQPPAYYSALFAWMEANTGVILNWLLDRDLRDFNPNKPPPLTAGKTQMINASTPPLEAIIRELIDEGEAPFHCDLIDLADALVALRGDASPTAGVSVNSYLLQQVLQKLGAKRFGQQKGRFDGKDVRASLWAVRHVDRYREMSPSERVKVYLEARSQRQPPF